MGQSEKSAERAELMKRITEEFMRLSEKYFYLDQSNFYRLNGATTNETN